MSDPTILASVIGSIGVILAAILGKISWDTTQAKRAAQNSEEHSSKVYDSINNRDESLSDRIDKLASKDDVRTIRRDISTLFAAQARMRQTQSQDRDELDEHIRVTAKLVPWLHDLHSRYSPEDTDKKKGD